MVYVNIGEENLGNSSQVAKFAHQKFPGYGKNIPNINKKA